MFHKWIQAAVILLTSGIGIHQPLADTVGFIPGAFSVDLSGSASYTIPIKTPPGIAGVEPHLSLVYNSQAIGSALGAGWSLSGLSLITRGPRDAFTDGEAGGISFTSNDALYLDGQRLIALSDAPHNGIRRVEYRKQQDDQTRIVQYGLDLSSAYFIVQTAAGIRNVFNGSNGSRVKTEDGQTLVLALSYTFDTTGNYIEYSYISNGVGNYEVGSIKFTGHGSFGDDGHLTIDKATSVEVDFTYRNARPLVRYIAGRRISADAQLATVESRLIGRPTPVGVVRLDYDETGNSNRFVLTTIHQIGSDGSEIAPTKFTYNKPPIGWQPAAFQLPNSIVLAGREHLEKGYRLANITQSRSLPDLLFSANIEGKIQSFVFRNKLDEASPHWELAKDFTLPVAFVDSDGADLGVILHNITSGGQSELFQSYQNSDQPLTSHAYKPGANGFEQDDSFKLPFPITINGRQAADVRFARFSGGQANDLIYDTGTVSGYLHNNGSGWDPPQPIPFSLSRALVIDPYCDGVPEVLVSKKQGAAFKWKLYKLVSGGWTEDNEPNHQIDSDFRADIDPAALKILSFKFGNRICRGILAATDSQGFRAALIAAPDKWRIGPIPKFALVDAGGRSTHAIVGDFHGNGLSDVIANTRFPDGTTLSYSWRQVADQWVSDPNFIPPLLEDEAPNRTAQSYLIGNIDGVNGSDIIVLSGARVLPNDPASKFGSVFISTPSGFVTKPDFTPAVQFARRDKQDTGVRILDTHGMGLPDIIFRKDALVDGKSVSVKGSYRNTGTGWVEEPGLVPPVPFASDDISANPVIFADVTHGGAADMVYSFLDREGHLQCHLYANAKVGQDSRAWHEIAPSADGIGQIVPPTCNPVGGKTFPIASAITGDGGVRFVKLNNTQLGMLVGIMPPRRYQRNGRPAPVQTCTTDPSGARQCKLDRSDFIVAAYLFDGRKWRAAPEYNPPLPFVAQVNSSTEQRQDLSVQLIDVNQDGLPDIVARFRHPHDPSVEVNEVWLNTGHGWALDSSISVPYPLDAYKRESRTIVQWADVNGDGIPDLVMSKRAGSTNLSQTWLGTGHGWQTAPDPNWQIPLQAISDREGDPGFRLVDVKGDGYLDVLYAHERDDGTDEVGGFLNNGSDWRTPLAPGTVPNFSFVDKGGSDKGYRLLSVTGRGLTDIVHAYEGDNNSVQINTSRRADVLQSITEGTGLKTDIYYESLLEHDGADDNYYMPHSLLDTRVYERTQTQDFPRISPTPTTYVVRRAEVKQSGESANRFSYRYGDYVVDSDASRSLGFKWRESLNEENGILTHSELLQDARFPHSLLRETTCDFDLAKRDLTKEQRTLCDGSGVPEGIKLTDTQNCWTLSEGDVSGGGLLHALACWDKAPRPSEGAIEGRPLKIRQIEMASAVTDHFELDGLRVSEEKSAFESYDSTDIVSRNPDIKKVTTTLSDGSFVETTNEYDDDYSRWLLRRLKKTTVIKHDRRNAQSETRVVTFRYDSVTGLLLEQIENPEEPNQVATKYIRDENGNVVHTSVWARGEDVRTIDAVFDRRGAFALSGYNALHQETSKVVDPVTGLPTKVTDLNGLEDVYEYDGFGRIKLLRLADGRTTETNWIRIPDLSQYFDKGNLASDLPSASFAVVESTTGRPKHATVFDAKSRAIRQITDAFTANDKLHKYVLTDIRYDILGNIIRESLPYEAGAQPLWKEVTYDLYGRAVSTKTPDGIERITTYKGNQRRNTPEVRNTRIQSCADLQDDQAPTGGGQVFVRVHHGSMDQSSYSCVDEQKRVLLTVDAKKGAVRFEYDVGGRTTKMIGAEGEVTSYIYDSAGNRVEALDPDLGHWYYKYDSFGKVIRQQDAVGNVVVMQYDKLDRILLRQQGDATTYWTYDSSPHGIGKIAVLASSNGVSQSYLYDGYSRPISVATHTRLEQFVIATTYDDIGRPSVITYPTGFAVRNLYDAKGFLTAVRDETRNSDIWRAIDLDIYGRVVTELYGNGALTNRSFSSANGRLEKMTSSEGKNNILSFDITYDGLNNIRTIHHDGANALDVYKYDDLNRLVSESNHDGSKATYEFDASGRIRRKSDVGKYVYASTGAREGSFPFHGVKSVVRGRRRENFTYDLNGNMVSTSSARYEYTADNQLSAIYESAAENTRFSYGPDGERLWENLTNGTHSVSTLTVGPYERVIEYNGAQSEPFGRLARNRFYISNGERVIAILERDSLYIDPQIDWVSRLHPKGEVVSTQTLYLHTDQTGSVIHITDERGIVKLSARYDVWGRRSFGFVASKRPTDIGRSWERGFTGHDYVGSSSLIHMNKRVYDSRLGIFLSPDVVNQSVGDSQASNGYMYARGNPLRFTDPTGLDFWDVVTAPARWVANGIADAAKGVGHFFGEVGKWLGENWRTVVVIIAVVVVTVVTMGALGPEAATLGGAILTGMAAGATAGGLTAALYGGSIEDVLTAAITGAAIGGVTGGLTWGVGEYFQVLAKAQGSLTLTQDVESVAAHGVVGGLSNAAQGQDFWSGFAGAAAATALQSFGPKFHTTGAKVVTAAVEGGTASVIGGGKFANGAISGALAYALSPRSAGGPAKQKGNGGGVAFVGGFFDQTLGDSGPVYSQYKEYSGDAAYFTWDQGDALAQWIDDNHGNVDIISHSYGADTAAAVVAAGHSVNTLITVDPVSWFPPDLSAVNDNSQTWRDVDARGGGLTLPNIIAGVGGAWNSVPRSETYFYRRDNDNDHANVMTHCPDVARCR